MADEAMIAVRDAWLTYGSGASAVSVLRGAHLDVPAGQSLAITGPSGSGKSTLLMLLGGLERPDQGAVTVAGENLVALSEDALTAFRGRAMGIVFQSFHLIPTMTALENVAVPLELAHVDGAHERARAELAAVGLGERADHYPTELSGGEQQRVAIARSVANAPLVLMADEPTGNLDPATAGYVFEALEALVRQSGLAALIATHNHEIAGLMDRRITLQDGQVVEMVAEQA